MAIEKEVNRQYVLSAVIPVTFSDLAAGAHVAADLPVGAVVVGGEITVTEAFDSTTNTLSVGDSASATRYAATADLKALARTALTLTGYSVVEATKQLLGTYALTGAVSTAGAASIRLLYVVPGRAHEVHG